MKNTLITTLEITSQENKNKASIVHKACKKKRNHLVMMYVVSVLVWISSVFSGFSHHQKHVCPVSALDQEEWSPGLWQRLPGAPHDGLNADNKF